MSVHSSYHSCNVLRQVKHFHTPVCTCMMDFCYFSIVVVRRKRFCTLKKACTNLCDCRQCLFLCALNIRLPFIKGIMTSRLGNIICRISDPSRACSSAGRMLGNFFQKNSYFRFSMVLCLRKRLPFLSVFIFKWKISSAEVGWAISEEGVSVSW